jgi:dTDP-4-amino-4,6-dideoxygalactose transaminase
MIPFHKPFISGSELGMIEDAIHSGRLSASGKYTHLCEEFMNQRYGFSRSFLTNSCTAALEMATLLMNILPGDEVILPAYTFVSTANAFLLRGAKLVFGDSSLNSPNMEDDQIRPLITPKTRVIVLVHYAGIACDMDPIMRLTKEHKLWLVEDAAHALEGSYKGRSLGSFGHFATFSFHETKNITAGEAGLLVVNDSQAVPRAELLIEKGTNRAAFLRGETAAYQWMDVSSSYGASELNAAFLYAQMMQLSNVQQHRIKLWKKYNQRLSFLVEKGLVLQPVPDYASLNAHLFYLLCASKIQRDKLISFLKKREIGAAFHYLPLHKSPFYQSHHALETLNHAEYYGDCLLRLPLYFDLREEEVDQVCNAVIEFYQTEIA